MSQPPIQTTLSTCKIEESSEQVQNKHNSNQSSKGQRFDYELASVIIKPEIPSPKQRNSLEPSDATREFVRQKFFKKEDIDTSEDEDNTVAFKSVDYRVKVESLNNNESCKSISFNMPSTAQTSKLATTSSSSSQTVRPRQTSIQNPDTVQRLDMKLEVQEEHIRHVPLKLEPEYIQEVEQISLKNRRGRCQTFPIFLEDNMKNPGPQLLLEKLVTDVTYDEDQSSDNGIVQDGTKKAKIFLIKNIKSMSLNPIRYHHKSSHLQSSTSSHQIGVKAEVN